MPALVTSCRECGDGRLPAAHGVGVGWSFAPRMHVPQKMWLHSGQWLNSAPRRGHGVKVEQPGHAISREGETGCDLSTLPIILGSTFSLSAPLRAAAWIGDGVKVLRAPGETGCMVGKEGLLLAFMWMQHSDTMSSVAIGLVRVRAQNK